MKGLDPKFLDSFVAGLARRILDAKDHTRMSDEEAMTRTFETDPLFPQQSEEDQNDLRTRVRRALQNPDELKPKAKVRRPRISTSAIIVTRNRELNETRSEQGFEDRHPPLSQAV